MSKARALPVIALLALAAASPAHADDVSNVCDPPVNANCVIRQDKTFFPTTASFDLGNLNLRVATGRTLTVAASITAPGTLTLKAGSVLLDPGASIVIRPDANGNGGHLTLLATRGITLDVQGTNHSSIDAGADSTGGRIDLVAGGDVLVQGLLRATGTPGSGGEISISAGGKITVEGVDLVQAQGGITGVGGSVTLIGGGPVFLDSSIDASGGLSGGALDLESGGDLTTTANAPLLVSSVDSGGDVLFDVRGSVTIGAKIDQSGKAGADFGGSGGELDMFVDGDITFNAPLDQSGTAPDGAGGLLDIEAGGSIIQNANAPITASGGNGQDSGGGSVDLIAGKDILLGEIDVSGGGFGGGAIDVESRGTTTVAGVQNADGGDAGDIAFVGLTVNVTASVHAAAQAADATGGTVTISACTIALPSGSELVTSGTASSVLLQASGAMTIGGTITSVGPNSFQYLDTLPLIQGGAVIQPPTTPRRNAALPTCDDFFPAPVTTTTTVPGATTTTTSIATSTTTITTTTIPLPTTTLPGTTTSSTSTSSSTTSLAPTTSTSSSTSTSSVTSSSFVTSTTSSTTTSTRPECSAGDACDDDDRCTVDSCAGGRCLHDPKIGADGVTCLLEQLDADLTEAGAGSLGGPARARALLSKVGKGRSLVEASRTLTGRKLLKKLKAADKQVGAFSKLVKRGQVQKKIATPLADRLLGLATDTSTHLQQLMTP